MKKILSASLMFAAVCGSGCNKKKDYRCIADNAYSGPVVIIKDCTGTYIRYLKKDYKVCNSEVLQYYVNGSAVNATFSETSYCSTLPMYICNMYHENEGVITINCVW
ncbi:MAG: hypothetical protein QM743_00720 [Chitinophagaceae bacterium]